MVRHFFFIEEISKTSLEYKKLFHTNKQHCKSSDNHNYLSERWLKPWLSMPTSNHYFLKNIKETTEKFFLKDKFLKRKLRPQFPYDRFLSEVKIKFVL